MLAEDLRKHVLTISGELFERHKEKIISSFLENTDKGVTLFIENLIDTLDGVKLRHNCITISNDNLVTLKVVRKTLQTLAIPYVESKLASGYLEVYDPSGDRIYRKKI